MRQFLLPGTVRAGQRLTILDEDHHYLAHVRRHRAGDELQAVDSSGNRCEVRIIELGGTAATLEVTGVGGTTPDGLSITVYQAIPKGRKLDDAIRWLVQAGVNEIVPIFTDRTVVQGGELGVSKRERWQRIAKEAVQQSGSSPVAIHPPCTLAESLEAWVANGEAAVTLYLHTEPLAQRSLHDYLGGGPGKLVLYVGPEGGFSDRESEQFQSRGALPLWLGPRVYRTETAGLVAVAAAQLLVLERSSWQLTK